MATTTVEEAKDKIQNIVQVISTTEQQITRQSKICSKNAVVCVLGNWNVCKVCQQEKFGGQPDGVVSITVEKGGPDILTTNNLPTDVN